MNRLFKMIAAILSLAAFVSLPDISYGRGVSSVDSISITAVLSGDGSAAVTEVWDVNIYEGTEWYLVRNNLGDIEITGLSVNGDGRDFENIGEWKVDRTIEQKAFKCGIVTKRDGCELCWGLGTHGKHKFTVSYKMTNAVKSLNDYDALHIQFVSPGIRPRPEKISVTLRSENQPFDEENAAVWAFGYEGVVGFEEGEIRARTEAPFASDQYSVILLARFNKGIFNSASVRDVDFAELQATAFKGSAYQEYLDSQENDSSPWILVAALGLCSAFMVLLGFADVRRRNLRIFGVKSLKEIGFFRDIPFRGNLLEAESVLVQGRVARSEGGIAGAMILRLLQGQYITVANNGRKKVDIILDGPASPDSLNGPALDLYRLLESAAGADRILQEKEFPRWASRHSEEIQIWLDAVKREGSRHLRDDGYTEGGRFLSSGQEQARGLIGLRNFLREATLINERKSVEVVLWQDYLVYAALFGIADKVAEELKEINPEAFEKVVGYDYPTFHRVIFLSNHYGMSMTKVVSAQNSSSVAGHGGFSSFGGGGGFSGGGFGGGAR